jgi:hypothetical protein
LDYSETIKKYFRVERKEIAYLKFIFEAYEGIAVVRTVDPDAGVIVLHISPGCERDVEMILQDLKEDMIIESYSQWNKRLCNQNIYS